jgi:methyltransferase (TIGR00027 family)
VSENILKEPSKMAEVVTLVRVGESEKPEDERICYDPYAIHFISPQMLEYMTKNPEQYKAEEKRIDNALPGYRNSTVARVRYFDDMVKATVKNGIEQLVILGAGYDTRAYRIKELENIRVFELDHPHTIKVKKEKIQEIFGQLPSHVTYITADLEVQKLEELLAGNGYEINMKTLFVMEGLIYYLPPEAVDELLSFIVNNSGKGSAIVFDYGRPNYEAAPEAKYGYEFAKQRGEPVKSSINEPVENFLFWRGFYKIMKMESNDYKKAYFHGKNASRQVSDIPCFAYAEVNKNSKREGPSKLAERIALIRASESKKPEEERICYDPYAIHFVISPEIQEFLKLTIEQRDLMFEKIEQGMPGLTNSIIARVKYFDITIQTAIDTGLEQLVILGAGYDTRAYRMKGLENIRVFEVDHPDTMSFKINKINEIFGKLLDHVTFISTDLEVDEIGHKLLEGGYDPSLKTLFIMEGLIMYLDYQVVDELLSFIVSNSGKGSAVAFDYGRVDNVDIDEAKSINEFVNQEGDILKFGMIGPVGVFLKERGFSNVRNMTEDDYKKAYFHGKNSDRRVSSMLWFAYAENN